MSSLAGYDVMRNAVCGSGYGKSCKIMLHRISYEALKKAAIYGAALSTTSSFVLYYQIQSEALVRDRSPDVINDVFS